MPAMINTNVWAGSRHYSVGVKLFILKPAIILAAQLNMPGADTYPAITLTYNNVTAGDWNNIRAGMTILIGSAPGLSDYGRQRVRSASSSTIGIGRSSRGRFPGEVNIVDDAYITVLGLHEVWSKIPYIQPPGGTLFKDGDIPVGTFNLQPPPIANCGIDALVDILPGDSTAIVNFTDQGSFAASGRTITNWDWDFGDGTPATSTDQDPGDVEFPEGARYIYLTVTDDVGHTHTACALIAVDGGTLEGVIKNFKITSHVRNPEGQEFAFSLHEDLDTVNYMDGTKVLASIRERYWSRARASITNESASVTVPSTANLIAGMAVAGTGIPSGTTIDSVDSGTTLTLSAAATATGVSMLTFVYVGTLAPGPTSRSHMIYSGWIHQESISNEASEDGLSKSVAIQCKDVAGRLAMLPGFTQILERNSAGASWYQFPSLTMDDYLKYLIEWHSNAADVADCAVSGTGSGFPIVTLGSDGASLYEQVDGRAQAIAYRYTCDRFGRLWVRKDNQLHASADRGSTEQLDLNAGGWYRYAYSRMFWPRTHWGDEAALLTDTTEANSVTQLGVVFAIAPGDQPGQGLSKSTMGQQLVASQTKLNERAGQRYDRANAPNSHFEFNIRPGEAGLDPAYPDEWMRATIPAAATDHRGRIYTGVRLQVRQVSFSYNHESGSRTQTVTGEQETGGFDAQIVIPPDSGMDESTVLSGYPIDLSTASEDALKMGKGTKDIVLIGTDSKAYVTGEFTYPSASGGPQDWAGTTISGLSGTPVAFVVDAFCPKYVNGSGTVDGWIATTTGLYKVTDLFGSPTASLQKSFRGTSSRRSLQSSFGERHIVCTSAYSDGVYRTHSTDGSTWSTETLTGSSSVISGDIAFPGAFASHRASGLAYMSAYLSTSAADGYKTDDYGGSVSALGAPDIDPGERLAGDIAGDYASGSDNTVLFGRKVTTSEQFNFTDGPNSHWSVVNGTPDYANNLLNWNGGGNPPAGGYLGEMLFYANAAHDLFTVTEINCGRGSPYSGTYNSLVADIWLEDADNNVINHIYHYAETAFRNAHWFSVVWTGSVANVHHIRFRITQNSGPVIYLYMYYMKTSTVANALYKAVGSSKSDMGLPTGYGPWKGRQIDISPVDSRYIVATGGTTDVATAGVWVSSNGGTSWTELVAPAASGSRYEHCAISGDGKNVIYLLGQGVVGICEDLATVDSRLGNMTSSPPSCTFIGIAGG